MAQRGAGTISKRGKIWWVQICVDGEVIRKSCGSEKYADAKKLRDKLLGQRERGELGGKNARLTISTLLDAFLKVLPTRVEPDTFTIQSLVVEAHLRPYFGAKRAEKITTDDLLAYREHRGTEKTSKGTPTSPSTMNRELSLLRNAMRTAAQSTPPLIPLSCIPRFPITNEDGAARQGFIEDADFRRVIAELPSYLVPIATTGYETGVRLGELKKIEWTQVDFGAQLIRLRSGRTKGGKPRTVPFIGEMERVLAGAKAERDANWPACKWAFSRLGTRLKDFRGAWDSACIRAGLPDLEFHDLRRSGVRNMSRGRTPERLIMAITGHKTRAMFDRYNIVSEADLDGVRDNMAAYRASKNSTTPISTDTISDTAPENGSGS
jgi:integrase